MSMGRPAGNSSNPIISHYTIYTLACIWHSLKGRNLWSYYLHEAMPHLGQEVKLCLQDKQEIRGDNHFSASSRNIPHKYDNHCRPHWGDNQSGFHPMEVNLSGEHCIMPFKTKNTEVTTGVSFHVFDITKQANLLQSWPNRYQITEETATKPSQTNAILCLAFI